MRVSQRNRSRSRSKENRENRSPHRRSSPEEADDRENQGERESDENEENDDPHRNNRTTRPSPRTTPITVSPAAPPFTTTLTNNPRAPGTTPSSSSSSTRTHRASGRPTTRISTTTSSAMSITSTAMQRIESSATTFAPQPGGSSSNKVTITVLAVVAGLVFFIVILLALCLAWRKWCQSRPPADVTKRDKSTYHMYSEIDHTTMILDEEPRGPSNQRVTEVNDKAVPSAPPQEDIPDILVNETYDMLHQKEQVQSKDDYSALDLRFVDLKDPRLNTYDVTSDIIGKSVSKEKTSDPSETDKQLVSEATVPKVEPTSGLTSDNITNISVHTDPKDNGGQYFVLEKVSDVTDSQNKVVQEHTEDPGSDNYFKLEPLA